MNDQGKTKAQLIQELQEAKIRLDSLDHVEAALRASEQHLDDIQVLGRIGTWEFDLETQAIKWSAHTYVLYEQDPQKGPLSVEEEATYYSPEQSAILHDYARQAIEEGKEFDYDLQVELPSGRRAEFTAAMRPIKNEEGQTIKLYGSIQDITERKLTEEKHDKLLHAMGERVKELRCLYGVTESIRTQDALVEIFQDVANLLPPGWHYPAITRGKVIFDGIEYISEPFTETKWKQSSELIINGKSRGAVEVYYLEECPTLDEGPFMTEERNLINGIASNLCDAIERKQAEEKVIKSEQEYQRLSAEMETIFDHIPGLVFYKDLENRFIRVNKHVADSYNMRKEELEGVSLFDLHSQDEGQAYWDDDLEVIRDGVPKLDIVESWDTPEGLKWVNTSKIPFIDEAGDIIGILGISTDITERKQAEQIQQVLLDISQAAAVTENLETFIESVREHLGEIIDTTNFYIALYDQDLDGYTFPTYFDQYDDMDNTLQILSHGPTESVRLAGKTDIWDEDAFIKARANKDIKLHGTDAKCWLGAPLRTHEGVIGVLAVQSYDNPDAYSDDDIKLLDNIVGTVATAIEKKQTEEALSDSEEDLRNLYENAMEGIFRTTNDGKFLFANPAMAKMFGYDSVEDLLNTDVKNLYYHDEQREESIHIYEQYGQVKALELEMLRKDGSKIWVRKSSKAVKDEDGSSKWYEGFISDITESKKLEQEILRSQKLESVGHLAGGLAHDFNNALTTIQLQAATAYIKKDVPPAVMEILNDIDQSVTKAMGITQQLLTFSKGGAPLRTITDIGMLIHEAVQFALSGTNITPTFEILDGLHCSEVDPNQINQVVSNLVINARHAMPNGGELKIAVKNISVTPANPLGTLTSGEYISVAIEDYGHGIDNANLDKIFDPYFTTKQDGSGLGLFSCHSIIDNHDGWMTVESAVSKGSVFTFLLPKSTEDIPGSANIIGSQEVINGTGQILIMDDEPSLRKSLAILLHNMGYTTSESSDGQEAIRIYSEALKAGTPFDVVILDLTIPKGLGGKETIKRLKEIDPEVKAIVSSGYSNDVAISDYKAYGFSAVLPKPYKLAMLAEVVKDTID